MNLKAKAGRGEKKSSAERLPPEPQPPASFSFGLRRYANKGPRRLFLAHKCVISPVFATEVERPHAILHPHSPNA